MTTCPGCGAPVHAGSRRCAACEASARRLIPGRPLPPPAPRPSNGDRTLVGAGAPVPPRARLGGGGAGRAGAWREPAPTQPMPRLYDVELDDWPDHWPAEDRRGRGLVLPVLVGTLATVLTIVGLAAVGDDRPERSIPAPDSALPTTVAPDAATPSAPTAPASTEAPSTLPTVPISAMTPPTTAATAAAAPAADAASPPVAAPPDAVAAAVEEPVPTEPDAGAVAQELASALADGDWARARQLNPAVAGWSDDEFEEGYGDLEASTVVPVGVRDAGAGRVDLRLGLVAHQRVDGDRQTTLYCVTWRVDPAIGTVGQQGSAVVLASRSSWVDPAAVAEEVVSGC